MSKKHNPELLPTMKTADVLEQLNTKIASLKRIEESVYKTNGSLDGFGDIKAETKIENLIRAFSSVKMREAGYNAAAKDLGRKEYPAFVIGSGTAEDWKQDILLRIDILEHKETLDKLNTFKEKMSKFMSEAEQKELLIKEMTDFFGTK